MTITNINFSFARNLSCDDELPWKEGSTLYNYLSGVSFNGLTGPIKWVLKIIFISLMKTGKISSFQFQI